MVALRNAEMKVELQIHSPERARDLNEFAAMGEQMAAKCRALLGKTVKLKNDRSGNDFTATAVSFRVEPTGFHQAIEIAWADDSGVHRMAVDECMLRIDQPDDVEPSDAINIEIPVGDSLDSSADDTVVLTTNGQEAVDLEPLDPLGDLRKAVTAHSELEEIISKLAVVALPIGMTVNCHTFGDGVIVNHSPSYSKASVEVYFKDRNGGKPMLISLAEIQINNEFLDANFIPF